MGSASADIFDPDTVSFPVGYLIAGELREGLGDPVAVTRPSDGKVVLRMGGASPLDVERAVEVARQAVRSGTWKDARPMERARVFRRWADLAEQHLDELVRLESVASTRLASEARIADIPKAIEIIRYYGELVSRTQGDVLRSADSALNFTQKEPYGVVAAISPWNMPIILSTIKLAPALAAGNAVLLKPSEFTPFSIVRLAQLAVQAGVPAESVAVLPGTGPVTGHALVTHPGVDYVTFTGSTQSGAAVMADAARHGPKPVSLELGGKSPQLVFADANIDLVADTVARSVIRNAGQICFAGTRLIVDEKIANEFTDAVRRRLSNVVPGPTWKQASTLSPVISEKQSERILDILRQGKDSGAEITLGGGLYENISGGWFFKPTLVERLGQDNPIVQEEVFGPVLTVQTFGDPEEALDLANDSEYGLAAGVYSTNLNTVLHCTRKLQAGTVWVNQYGPDDIASPIGGFKKSGFGKDFGADGYDKYLRVKNVRINFG